MARTSQILRSSFSAPRQAEIVASGRDVTALGSYRTYFRELALRIHWPCGGAGGAPYLPRLGWGHLLWMGFWPAGVSALLPPGLGAG